jgi:hypothetical protein
VTIDPKLQYCSCGMTWTPGTRHKILMLLFGEYTRRCPQCGTRMTFKLMNHVVKVRTEAIKDKEKLWNTRRRFE